MLSSFCCSLTCLKWLRLLNVHLKESCVVFIIWEYIIVVFSFDALFGLTWRMLTACLTLTSRLKPLWSFGFWLVIPVYALVNNVLSLCMIMVVIVLLVGRSQSFASLHMYWVWALLGHPTTKNQVYSKESTINSYAWYLQAIPSKFSCANTSHFVTLFLAHGDVVVRFAIFHIVIFQKKGKKRKRHSSMVCESWWAHDGID
jgi:hypothetical protein